MKKLHIDRFWGGLSCAAGLLAILWACGLLPKIAQSSKLHAELEVKAEELRLARAGTPSRSDIENWSKYKVDLARSQSQMTTFLSDHSRSLRQWFANLRMAPDGEPPRDSFVGRYQDEARELENSLSKLSAPVRVGGAGNESSPGFNWEDLSIDHWDSLGRENERSVLRELQKRFWVRRRVANLAFGGRVALKRIVDFRFFRRLHEKFPEKNAVPGGIPSDQWPGATSIPENPADPGRLLTFGFAVELSYGEITKAIHEFISPATERSNREDMLVNVLGTHISICEQNPPVEYFTYDPAIPGEEEEKAKEILKSSKPRSVILSLSCQILDFDPARAKVLTSN